MVFHHIGIFVKSIEIARNTILTDLKGKKFSEIIIDDKLKVKVQFLKLIDNTLIELVEGIGDNNPVINSIKNNKNILNHIGFKSDSFDKDYLELKNKKFIQITEILNAKAFNNKRIVFFITPLNFCLELIEN